MTRERSERSTWRILDVLDWTRAHFEKRGIETARLDAEVLLAHVLDMQRVMLYARFDQPLTETERARYRELVRRRADREPIAYILEKREFWSLDLEVRPGVLVPRPDTETLVQVALSLLPDDRPVRVVDVGTGSGAIALAFARERPRAEVWAVDRFDVPLEVAAANAERLGLHDRVRVTRSDLLDGLPPGLSFDLVAANLPYVPSADLVGLMPEVARYEPKEALDGGADGLDLVRRLIAEAPARMHAGAALVLEAGSPEVSEVAAGLTAAGYEDVRTHADDGGRPRIACGRRPRATSTGQV